MKGFNTQLISIIKIGVPMRIVSPSASPGL